MRPLLRGRVAFGAAGGAGAEVVAAAAAASQIADVRLRCFQPMNRWARIIMPLLAGVAVAGCLHAPASPEERRTGADLVGGPESTAPLRVGTATRAELVQRLGEPDTDSADGRAI